MHVCGVAGQQDAPVAVGRGWARPYATTPSASMGSPGRRMGAGAGRADRAAAGTRQRAPPCTISARRIRGPTTRSTVSHGPEDAAAARACAPRGIKFGQRECWSVLFQMNDPSSRCAICGPLNELSTPRTSDEWLKEVARRGDIRVLCRRLATSVRVPLRPIRQFREQATEVICGFTFIFQSLEQIILAITVISGTYVMVLNLYYSRVEYPLIIF